MAIENLTNIMEPEILVRELTSLTHLFEALGGFVIAYIVFNIVNMLYNRKKEKEFSKMRELLESIDEKLDQTKISKTKN